MFPILWTALALASSSSAADPPSASAEAPAPAPAPPAPLIPLQTHPAPPTGVAPFVGLQVGAAFSLTPLDAAFLPRLELGIELPWAQRRFRAVLLAAWTRPTASDEADDARVPEGTWTWDLKQDEGLLALGATVRIPEISDRFVPEVTLAPQLCLLRTRVDGEAGGAAFGESTEQYTRVGFHSSVGAATALGRGEASLLLAFSISELNGVVTGDSSTVALAPMLGYRVVF